MILSQEGASSVLQPTTFALSKSNANANAVGIELLTRARALECIRLASPRVTSSPVPDLVDHPRGEALNPILKWLPVWATP